MEVQYKVSNVCTIKIAGDGQKDIFKELASAVEIFGQVSECGACGSQAVPRVRIVEDNHFHEAACTNSKCRAVLAFGAHKKNGSLFPKRKDADGNWLPSNGWTIFKPDAKKNGSA